MTTFQSVRLRLSLPSSPVVVVADIALPAAPQALHRLAARKATASRKGLAVPSSELRGSGSERQADPQLHLSRVGRAVELAEPALGRGADDPGRGARIPRVEDRVLRGPGHLDVLTIVRQEVRPIEH